MIWWNFISENLVVASNFYKTIFWSVWTYLMNFQKGLGRFFKCVPGNVSSQTFLILCLLNSLSIARAGFWQGRVLSYRFPTFPCRGPANCGLEASVARKTAGHCMEPASRISCQNAGKVTSSPFKPQLQLPWALQKEVQTLHLALQGCVCQSAVTYGSAADPSQSGGRLRGPS